MRLPTGWPLARQSGDWREVFDGSLRQELVGGFGPGQRVAAGVPAVDEGPDLGGEVAGAREGAAVDGFAFDEGEPDLDEVHPGRRGGGVVEPDPRVRREPGTRAGVCGRRSCPSPGAEDAEVLGEPGPA